MALKTYWKQSLPLLCVHVVCMAALAVFLLLSGNSADSVAFILSIWAVILTAYLCKAYYSRKVYLEKLLELTRQLEERYLISEVMEKPDRIDDQIYYQILKMTGKSMLEQIASVKCERIEYKEYIEQWIHEIKTPITAMKLICENHRPEMPKTLTKELLLELEKTNRFTEQALYYARSEHTEKDYSVREIRLFDVVHQAIAENKHLLLNYNVRIDVQETEATVYSDEKWLCFILNQMIVNAVKYRSEEPQLRFFAAQSGGNMILNIADNGIGIVESELPRIFEKGFTGKNGRNASQNATGIGLYLCRRLCDKLGIGITVTSSDHHTVFQLCFPIDDFIREVQG